MSRRPLLALMLVATPLAAAALAPSARLAEEVDSRTAQVLPSVLARRRDIHEHSELSNREFRTAKLVADHLTRRKDPATAPRNHSPLFFADEAALPVGVRALASLALDWLSMNSGKPAR